MNNINKGVILNLELKILKLLGDIAEKVTDSSTRGCYLYLVYEPEFPKELLDITKEEN